MKIGGFQKISLIDYPGKITSIIFFSGCNFRCPFCYSSELVLPERIKEHPIIAKDKVLGYLKDRQGMIEAVVFCGGEPTLVDELESFAQEIKALGYYIKLDTNGSNPRKVERLIEKQLIDYIAMDVKAPVNNQEKYNLATGCHVDIDNILHSINLIKSSGVDYEFRSTIVPGIHTLNDIELMAQSISPAKKYYLQQFIGEKETINQNLKNTKPFLYEDLSIVLNKIKEMFDICEIR